MDSVYQHNICLENVEYFKTKCRICLQENQTKLSLFENYSENNVTYCILIKEYFGINIDFNELLSNEICEECIKELIIAINLVDKIKSSIDKFNHFLFVDASDGNTNEENIEILDSDNEIQDDGAEILSMGSDINCQEVYNGEEINNVKDKLKKLEEELSFGLKFKKSKSKMCQDNKPKVRNRISYKNVTISELREINVEMMAENENIDESKYEILNTMDGIKKQVLKCKDCGVVSKNRSAFRIHYRRHSGIRPFQCKICLKLFTQSGTLNAHMRKGHSVKQSKPQHGLFICDTCGKKYMLRSSLITHLRVHNVESQLQCYFCPQRFIKSSERLVHVRVHHTGEKPFFCDKCGKTFAASTNLNTHMLRHSDERNFKCEFCEKLMKSHENLKRHILTVHSKEKKVVCDYCGYTFALKNKLLHHIKTWHLNKEYGYCEICCQNFNDIKKHIKSHFGDKPFGCTMCHKTFNKERSLMKHYVTHNTERFEFKCPHEMCESQFSKKRMLDFHIVKCHDKETSFPCRRCPQTFYQRGDLGRHMTRIHNIWLLPIRPKRCKSKNATIKNIN